jgi:hypothetical protein
LPENASLRVDGQRLKRVGAGRVWTLGNSGGSPPSAFSLMVRRGDHSFEVWHGNLVEKKENRNVTGAKGTIDVTKSAPPPVVDEGPGLQPLDWGLIGGGTAALVTSGVLAVAGQNKRAEAEDLCPNDQCDTDEGNDAVASGKGLMTGSAIAALVGVGALAWEVVRLTEERPKERPPEPIWNLTIGSAGLQSWSLVTGGRF